MNGPNQRSNLGDLYMKKIVVWSVLSALIGSVAVFNSQSASAQSDKGTKTKDERRRREITAKKKAQKAVKKEKKEPINAAH